MKTNIVILIILIFMVNLSYGRTLKEINADILREKQAINKLEKEKGALKDQVALINSQIANYRQLISEINKERSELEKSITILRSQIRIISKSIDKSRKAISKSNMYVIDNLGYSDIKIITTSKDTEDTIAILEILGKANTNLHKEVEILKIKVNQLKSLRKEEEYKVSQLDILQKERKEAVKELRQENNRYNKMITALQHDEAGRREYLELLVFQKQELDNKVTEESEKYANTQGLSNKGTGGDRAITIAMADDSPFGRLVKKLPMPVSGKIIEHYGEYTMEGVGMILLHKGIKISPATTAKVQSVANGTVIFADNVKNFNNLVIIDHGSSYYTVYGNMDNLYIKDGDKVKQGSVVGEIIVEPDLDNSYLYFELRKKEDALNPALWFKKG